MSSPATSGYPGTPVMVFFACVFAILLAFVSWRGVQSRWGKPDLKDWKVYFLVGLIDLYLLGTALWSIRMH
jgi:hypothetical protein